MSFGVFSDGHPRISLSLPGERGTVKIEFIVDTGFAGDLALPARLARQIESWPIGLRESMLANGLILQCPVHAVALERDGEPHTVELLTLDGDALVGTQFYEEYLLQVEMTQGGDVAIDPL